MVRSLLSIILAVLIGSVFIVLAVNHTPPDMGREDLPAKAIAGIIGYILLVLAFLSWKVTREKNS